jgi:Putative addiction module component
MLGDRYRVMGEQNRATEAGAFPGEEASPAEIEAAWAAEIEQRVADLDSGKVKPIPWPEVREKLYRLTPDEWTQRSHDRERR